MQSLFYVAGGRAYFRQAVNSMSENRKLFLGSRLGSLGSSRAGLALASSLNRCKRGPFAA